VLTKVPSETSEVSLRQIASAMAAQFRERHASLQLHLTPLRSRNMNLENLRNLTEVFAFIAAVIFFGYKFLTGYFITNLSLSLACSRQESLQEGKDHLAVVARLSKGERGSLDLHDAQVRASWSSDQLIKPLIGIERQSFETEKLGEAERKVINFKCRSKTAPFLRLTPGEETSFACYFEVPSESICVVELIVLGRLRRIKPIGQWRASAISTPLTKANLTFVQSEAESWESGLKPLVTS